MNKDILYIINKFSSAYLWSDNIEDEVSMLWEITKRNYEYSYLSLDNSDVLKKTVDFFKTGICKENGIDDKAFIKNAVLSCYLCEAYRMRFESIIFAYYSHLEKELDERINERKYKTVLLSASGEEGDLVNLTEAWTSDDGITVIQRESYIVDSETRIVFKDTNNNSGLYRVDFYDLKNHLEKSFEKLEATLFSEEEKCLYIIIENCPKTEFINRHWVLRRM